MPQLLAVCVVHALRPDDGVVGVTAIDKRPASGPVKIGPYGARSDVQADRKSHGGLAQALYAYSTMDADWWGGELGHELAPGWFGENLRVDGLDLSGARIGERWRVGAGADAVELEVTAPRRPCQTFARWADSQLGGGLERGWVKRFQLAGRPGAYLRVIRNGRIAAGDEIEILSRPDDAPTIAEVFRDGELSRTIKD
ncbi:MOSC domain-containing protein [Lysinimonas soli]|uniref:MOSC domain-containing protein n=1 Tax=Lysinimonas soli TaxID=1074233 RepID=A0ABW0NP67_9MICO